MLTIVPAPFQTLSDVAMGGFDQQRYDRRLMKLRAG
jgi:hypothetical protein